MVTKTDIIMYLGAVATLTVMVSLMLISLIKARYKNIRDAKNKAKYVQERMADIYKTLSSVDYNKLCDSERAEYRSYMETQKEWIESERSMKYGDADELLTLKFFILSNYSKANNKDLTLTTLDDINRYLEKLSTKIIYDEYEKKFAIKALDKYMTWLKVVDDIPESKRVCLMGKLEDKIDNLRNLSAYYI